MAAIPCLAAGATFIVDAGHSAGKVSPALYGLMTEEINHSYDGGLYAELIQNRVFLDNTNTPVHWSVVNDESSAAAMALEVYQERPEEFQPFSSKYDAVLRGAAELSASEARGRAAFDDPTRGNCASCHPSEPKEAGSAPLFSDFGYVAIGRNYERDQPIAVLQDFEDTIFEQDRRVVESQRPEMVPFDLADELHLKFDAVAVAYRRAMRRQGLAASRPP